MADGPTLGNAVHAESAGSTRAAKVKRMLFTKLPETASPSYFDPT
jgi:hypothetical protein